MDTLGLWQRRARESQKAHYRMALRCRRRSSGFAAGGAGIAAAIGVLVLLSARYQFPDWAKIVIAALSLIGAGLATIQGVLKPAEDSEKHHNGGLKYGAVIREIASATAIPPRNRSEAEERLKHIREMLDAIPGEAPAIPQRVWRNLGPLTPDPIGPTSTNE